jgi:hypothetical protein
MALLLAVQMISPNRTSGSFRVLSFRLARDSGATASLVRVRYDFSSEYDFASQKGYHRVSFPGRNRLSTDGGRYD